MDTQVSRIGNISSEPLWKPRREDKETALQKRAQSKRELLKKEPAGHDELHYCYIGDHWVKRFDLEHVIDASERPDLRDNPKNHKKACNRHNIAKKLDNLTASEANRVKKARAEVLRETAALS